MKRIVFLIAGFLIMTSTALFCAQQEESKACIDEQGAVTLTLGCIKKNDLNVLCALCDGMNDNICEPAILSIYKKSLMRVNTTFVGLTFLMLSSVYKNPVCVEHMVYEYIPRQEQPILSAFFMGVIGMSYREKGEHRDAQRMLTESLHIIPNATAMKGLIIGHELQNNIQGTSYWIDQYQQRKFKEGVIKTGALEVLHQRSNEQAGQTRSPEEFLAHVRAYQPEDPNERALVEKYNSIFKKDPA